MDSRGLVGLVVAGALTVFAPAAMADDPAETVRTSGVGRLEKVTNYFVFSAGSCFDAQIPQTITAGQRIMIRYVDGGKTVVEDFVVAEVAIRGDLCWARNFVIRRHGTNLDDTITIKPCMKVR